MSLRMQLRRIVIMMINEYAVLSLALKYPCKKYHIIYESVHIYLCTRMRNKYIPMKSEFVWNVHIEVMVCQFSTCMSLLRHGCQRNSFWNCTLSLINKLTICPDINGFQIPLKTSCTRHRWRKAKDLLVFCSGKICLVLLLKFWRSRIIQISTKIGVARCEAIDNSNSTW